MKKVAILQSNYIPWKGYFDIIHSVDEFILYDDMQYTRRDWRNRNKIVAANDLTWLSIPVQNKGKYFQKINETQVSDHRWIDQHIHSLTYAYSKAPYYKEYADIIFHVYEQCRQECFLTQINYLFLTKICEILGIETKITFSSDYTLVDGKTERLVELCKEAGGSYYLSGPAAKDYIEEHFFEKANIELHYMDYTGYPEYPQLFDHPFEPGVTVLDLIFNVGQDAPKYIWGWKEK